MKTETKQTIESTDDVILDALMPQGNTQKKSEKKFNFSNSILLDVITDLTKVKFIWQCAAITLGIVVLTSGFVCFNLYSSNKNLNARLSTVSQTEAKLAQSSSEIEKLNTEVRKTDAELKNAQKELTAAKAESAALQEKLNNTSEQLKDLQDRNAEVVKILNGRLQKLTTSETPQRH